MKNLLSIEALSRAEILDLLDLADTLKKTRGGHAVHPLAGQVWALIFSKSSTRTRVSFEVGIRELGGQVMFLSAADIQLGRGEPIKDTARVLGRMVHGAVIRTYAQKDVEDFAEFSGIPTINALTDLEHPCQILADLMTIREIKGGFDGLKVCFVGDGDCNVARSWIWAAHKLGFEMRVAAPEKFQPPSELLERAGKSVRVVVDVEEAAKGADILYTDVWISMGKEQESAYRIAQLTGYQINASLVRASNHAAVMHCLPAYREKEITDEVMEAHSETIFQQAENRLHIQKAILTRVAAR